MFKILTKTIMLILIVISGRSFAALNTLEVGVATLPATTGNALTSISFTVEFSETPLVFVMTTDAGTDPCTLRIDNVTVTGFDLGCVEPVNEDGAHPGMSVDYIAIIPGTTTVPSNISGSVTFLAGSIETSSQHYGPTCSGCSGTQAYDSINFGGAFSSTPVFLSNIQTINTGIGNNPFIDTGVRNLTSAGVQVTLDQMEAGTGPIAADETIGYLAIETTGCEDLDFSSFSGPSSMVFQSVLGGNVDGWGNNCTSGEGATFASMCFSSTPVAIAKQRTLNGNNGGMLRRCSVSASEIILTFDEDRVSNNERNHIDESVGVAAFGSVFTTPVTLSHFRVDQQGRWAEFDWQTATETFNIGFNLWGKLDGEWIQLNKRLIPAQGKDQLAPQQYQKRIKLTAYQRSKLTDYGLANVDADGKETFFGPFKVGQDYGEQAVPEPIDWQAVRTEYEQRMINKGFVFHRGKWRRANKVNKANPSNKALQRVDMSIVQDGVYEVSFEELEALGVDWDGTRHKHIALSYKGKPVSRHIISDNKRFDAGDRIQFVAFVPAGEDALYTGEAVYQLSLEKHKAQDMIAVDHTAELDSATADDYLYSVAAGENTFYSDISPADPWLDAEIFSYGGAAQKSYILDMPADIVAQKGGQLALRLTGGIDYPANAQTNPDHHLQVYVNDVLVADERNDGFVDWKIDTTLAADVLNAGANQIRLVLPGDTGNAADIVNVDQIELSAYRPLNFAGKSLFSAKKNASSYALKLQAEMSATDNILAYAYQHSGNAARITEPQLISGQSNELTLLLPALAMQNKLEEPVFYWVSDQSAVLSPVKLQRFVKESLIQAEADYLIVAHPNFIGPELQAYVDEKNAEGLRTRVIDWTDVVQQYGYGMNTPQALNHFLIAADTAFSYQYVLIVGGHSYDYHDYLQQGSVNFVPSYYRKVNLINYAPSDVPFVDIDHDGLPDKAIGRWPVRTISDLNVILQKTRDWQANGMEQARNALFIAEQAEDSLKFAERLDNTASLIDQRWVDITRVYMDELIEQQVSQPIATARNRIIDRINQGVGLTVFNGHGSPSAWTFQSLVNWSHLQQLDNAGLPTMVMPLACYTTYYETPSVNSLAHQWLFGGDKGAVAIHGAMVLGEFRENEIFAKRVLKQQLEEGSDLGTAILRVKQRMAPWNYMVNNWALLGDPTLRLSN